MDRLTKNFIWMAAANIVGSFFVALVIICLARRLGPIAFGYFSYAQMLIVYLANFVDLGFPTYGTREVSKDRSRISDYVSDIISFRLLVALILAALFVVIVFLSRQPIYLKIFMAGMSLLLLTQACTAEWAFQGAEKMHMVLVSYATTTFLQFTLVWFFIKGPRDFLKVPFLLFAGFIPITVSFLRRLKFTMKIRRLDLHRIRSYLASSLVIWMITLFVQLYNGLDIVLLGLFRRPEEVGYLSIARKVIGGIALLLVYLTNAALPRLSVTFCRDRPAYEAAIKKFLKLAVLIAFFVLLPLVFFGDSIIALTVGSLYLPAALPLVIMAAGLVFILFNLPYSTGLVAAGFEKEVLKQAMASAALNVAANLALIPAYGMIGAAVSFLMAEALALVWILAVYEKKIGIFCRSVV